MFLRVCRLVQGVQRTRKARRGRRRQQKVLTLAQAGLKGRSEVLALSPRRARRRRRKGRRRKLWQALAQAQVLEYFDHELGVWRRPRPVIAAKANSKSLGRRHWLQQNLRVASPGTSKKTICTIIAWVRRGIRWQSVSHLHIWIALRTVRKGDEKNSFLLAVTLKSYAGDWPTVSGCPVSNPGYNCANGLLTPECRKAVCANSAKRFKVLAKARNSGHLGFLEAVYISRLSPVLCSQKEFAQSLAMF